MVILKLKKITFIVIKVLLLEDVDIENVLVSNKISSVGKSYEYFIGYLHDDYKVEPLRILLPQRNAYVKRF